MSVVLLKEHSLNVELLCDCSVKLRASRESEACLVLYRPSVTVSVGADDHDELGVVSWVVHCDGYKVVQNKRFLIHSLHGTCLRGSGTGLPSSSVSSLLSSGH